LLLQMKSIPSSDTLWKLIVLRFGACNIDMTID